MGYGKEETAGISKCPDYIIDNLESSDEVIVARSGDVHCTKNEVFH